MGKPVHQCAAALRNGDARLRPRAAADRPEFSRSCPDSISMNFCPMIWGPAYAIGVSVAGKLGIFEYAAEIKNAPVASRPEVWDDFDFRSSRGRICGSGFSLTRPGISAFPRAEGPYLTSDARPLAGSETIGRLSAVRARARMSVMRAAIAVLGGSVRSAFRGAAARRLPMFSPTTWRRNTRSRRSFSAPCAGTRNFSRADDDPDRPARRARRTISGGSRPRWAIASPPTRS